MDKWSIPFEIYLFIYVTKSCTAQLPNAYHAGFPPKSSCFKVDTYEWSGAVLSKKPEVLCPCHPNDDARLPRTLIYILQG